MDFKNFIETNINDLIQSTIAAFPNTTKRQHVIDEIEISEVKLTPFLGVKTLFCRCLAVNETNGHRYAPMILFKNVPYYRSPAADLKSIDDAGQTHYIEKIESNDVLVRCNCKDFKFRFEFCDNKKSLYGSISKRYKSSDIANPLQLEGACKHILKFIENLRNDGFII